ncbi:MAG: PQQ-binding-like beta-propeller repeat protein [Planctomycetes bacterium]|nr:PQQ-binding-like beta-propeller repeat protein [Planctomycetota bacterium]
MKTVLLIAATVIASVNVVVLETGNAADWPTWRADAQRSGSVRQPLADELHLQWIRSLPPRRVAWPNEPRLQFDASYEPVVLGSRLFVASSSDGSVTAFDTRSGETIWRFYSEGPVRLAPVAWKDRVFFGSDDGFLYCLLADTGELLWKIRGAPADRPDYRHLGNARLVSYWPVRGGPVLDSGTIYFAAGIWPTMGVFIHAVDAQSGKIRWTNSNTNYIQNVRIDHNNLDDVGLSPQGYCLMVDGKLVVPNGRSMPARFDPGTGQLQYYVQGYRNGDSRVTAGGRFLFVGRGGVVGMHDGREVGNRWVEAGEDAPAGWDAGKRDLFEGPFYGYKFLQGCDYRSVFDRNIALGVEKGFLHTYDLTRPRTTLYDKKVGEQVIHPARWDPATVWQRHFLAEPATQSTRVTIKAGDRLYTHVGRTLFAVDIPRRRNDAGDASEPHAIPTHGKEPDAPRVAWKKVLEAVPSSMAAADGKLFVVLQDGRICCFGAEPAETRVHSLPSESLSDAAQQTARRLLDATSETEGYALVLGLESGRLVDALLGQSDLHLIAVDPDQSKIDALRSHYVRAGVYGTRVEAFVGDPASFRFPPYLANLIVSERTGDASPLARIPPSRLFSLLRPYGGAAVILRSLDATRRQWTEAKIAGAKVEAKDEQVVLRRVGAPAGAADWTHETGDAARTYFSADQGVKAPLALLWYGDGPDHGFQKFKDYGRGVKPQVAHGRLFAFDDRAEQLSAIDIYTGRLLWRHDTGTSLVRFASLPEAVYVASGLKCDVLDPVNGALKTSFTCDVKIESGKQPGAVAVRATDELLVIGIGFDLPAGHSHPAIESGLWDARALVAFDRRTGKQLWTRTADKRFNLHAIAIGGNAVYCVDSTAPLEVDNLARRGIAPETSSSTTFALDARTGSVAWKKTFEYGYRAMTGRGPLAIRPYDDWVAFNREHGLVLSGKLHEIHALSAETGEEMWNSTSAGMQPIILNRDCYINQAGHRFDVTSGKRLSTEPLFRRTGGCNYTVGSRNMLFLRKQSVTYIDLEKREEHSLRNVRSGCSNSLVTAGGLLNAPCFSTGCVCNYPLQTSFSMYHLPESGAWSGEAPIALPKE